MQKLDTLKLAQSANPETEALKQLGDLSTFSVLGSNVLVWTYIQPEKTSGGIIRISKAVDEDRYQGKVGRILAMGENAFKYDGPYECNWKVKPQVGDYIMFHTSDARELGIKGVPCKLVDSSLVRMIVPDPSAMY